MKVFPVDASESEVLAYVDGWVRKLEEEDYEGALVMTGHDPGWTPELLRHAIKSYGKANPDQRATLEARPTDVSQRKEVDRWDDAPNGSLGEVWYDLGIDGLTSDLTAIFDLVPAEGGMILRLGDVHIM